MTVLDAPCMPRQGDSEVRAFGQPLYVRFVDGELWVTTSQGIVRNDATSGGFIQTFIPTASGGLPAPEDFVVRDWSGMSF